MGNVLKTNLVRRDFRMTHHDKPGRQKDCRSKRVLFTGIGGCIGEAILEKLIRDNWQVAALGHVESSLEPTVVDFRDDDAIASAIEAIGGEFDAIILSHGVLEAGPWSDTPPAAWRHVMDINLNSIYAILHTALPRMRERSAVVVMSSTAAYNHSPVGGPHYTASKWALNGLVRHLADELGPSGIRINAVCPGLVDSPMGRALLSEKQYLEAFEEIPLRRPAQAEEIANAVMFLISTEASYITGSLIPVSGGYQ
jgi:NAD(P)-dependent dehydrogenase (short-subunit alcohol dehydrogenase family)